MIGAKESGEPIEATSVSDGDALKVDQSKDKPCAPLQKENQGSVMGDKAVAVDVDRNAEAVVSSEDVPFLYKAEGESDLSLNVGVAAVVKKKSPPEDRSYRGALMRSPASLRVEGGDFEFEEIALSEAHKIISKLEEEAITPYRFMMESRGWGIVSKDGVFLSFRFPRLLAEGWKHKISLTGEAITNQEKHYRYVFLPKPTQVYLAKGICLVITPDEKVIKFYTDQEKKWLQSSDIPQDWSEKKKQELLKDPSLLGFSWKGQEADLCSLCFLLPTTTLGTKSVLTYVWSAIPGKAYTLPSGEKINSGEVAMFLNNIYRKRRVYTYNFFEAKDDGECVPVRFFKKPSYSLDLPDNFLNCIHFKGVMTRRNTEMGHEDRLQLCFKYPAAPAAECVHPVDVRVLWKMPGSGEYGRHCHKLSIGVNNEGFFVRCEKGYQEFRRRKGARWKLGAGWARMLTYVSLDNAAKRYGVMTFLLPKTDDGDVVLRAFWRQRPDRASDPKEPYHPPLKAQELMWGTTTMNTATDVLPKDLLMRIDFSAPEFAPKNGMYSGIAAGDIQS